MSASLVGSEMCIRDSPPPRRTAKRKRRRTKRRASCAWTCEMGVSDIRRFGCLLYTSDAADDM
eukprot:9385749-Alexandrium_andersonii.AAC.1